MLLLLEESKI